MADFDPWNATFSAINPREENAANPLESLGKRLGSHDVLLGVLAGQRGDDRAESVALQISISSAIREVAWLEPRRVLLAIILRGPAASETLGYFQRGLNLGIQFNSISSSFSDAPVAMHVFIRRVERGTDPSVGVNAVVLIPHHEVEEGIAWKWLLRVIARHVCPR